MQAWRRRPIVSPSQLNGRLNKVLRTHSPNIKEDASAKVRAQSIHERNALVALIV